MISSFIILMTLLASLYIFYKLITSNFLTWKSEGDIIHLIKNMKWRLDWAIVAVFFTFSIKETVRAVIYFHSKKEANTILMIVSILFVLSLYWLAGEIHAETRLKKKMDKKTEEIENLVADKEELDKELAMSKEQLEIATRNLEMIKEGSDYDTSIYELAKGE